jgi:hypothetical protein
VVSTQSTTRYMDKIFFFFFFFERKEGVSEELYLAYWTKLYMHVCTYVSSKTKAVGYSILR